jgi:hypothetical protein
MLRVRREKPRVTLGVRGEHGAHLRKVGREGNRPAGHEHEIVTSLGQRSKRVAGVRRDGRLIDRIVSLWSEDHPRLEVDACHLGAALRVGQFTGSARPA